MRNDFVSKVFQWLCIGLLITFGGGYALSLNETLALNIANAYLFIILAELVCGFGLSLFIRKMSDSVAKIFYILYAALTGVTFMAVFLFYDLQSIMLVFLATAVIFGVCGLIGKKLKINLSSFGMFLVIALIGIIVLSIINIFVGSEPLDLTISLVSVVIFSGYIIYDINRIMRIGEIQVEEKYAVFGAFQLYLDIINIILDLLRIFGKERD